VETRSNSSSSVCSIKTADRRPKARGTSQTVAIQRTQQQLTNNSPESADLLTLVTPARAQTPQPATIRQIQRRMAVMEVNSVELACLLQRAAQIAVT
jgi:hypothetical protein